VANEQPGRRLAAGDEAPEFDLPATGDTAGRGGPRKMVRLSESRRKGSRPSRSRSRYSASNPAATATRSGPATSGGCIAG
jgi:hypothetical protein